VSLVDVCASCGCPRELADISKWDILVKLDAKKAQRLSVVELRNLLTTLDLSIEGTKPFLISRLLSAVSEKSNAHAAAKSAFEAAAALRGEGAAAASFEQALSERPHRDDPLQDMFFQVGKG